RRPNPDRLTATGSQDEPQARRRIDRAPRDRDRQRVLQPVRAGSVRVDLGHVPPAGGQEREWDVEGTRFLVGDGAEVPVRTVPLPPRHYDVVADLPLEHARGVPVDRHVADELEGWL